MKKQVTVHVTTALTIMVEGDELDDQTIEDMVSTTVANMAYDFSIEKLHGAGEIIETEIIEHTVSHVVDITDEVEEVHDVDVICVADLDDEFKAGFTKPWALQFADGSCLQYDTEDEACEAQRNYRSQNGLDPITGEVA